MFRAASDRLKRLIVGVALSLWLLANLSTANAQVTPEQQATTAQGPDEPPLYAPVDAPLASGASQLSVGQWLLFPTVDMYAAYDTNIHSSPVAPLSGPELHFHPSLLADLDTGIYDTKVYGNIDSQVYPTLDYHNNTFDRQAGVVETYSPLPDLDFTLQGDYSHHTNANVLTNSIPTPVTSEATPAQIGAGGVVAGQQIIVDPNDTYTLTGGVYKEFDRAFVRLGGSILHTDYETTSISNYSTESYNGTGGFWLTPWFYAFADGTEAFTQPAVGQSSDSFRARGGIGSAPIGLFKGAIYYGDQGTEVTSAGTAGGDIYGGEITYVPTVALNLGLSVDRLRNVSDITSGTTLALGGLPFVGVGVPTTASTEVTTVAFKSNYAYSPQTFIFGVVSDSRIAYLNSSRVDNSWLASVGIQHQILDDLSMNFSYQYTDYVSPEPMTSFTRNVLSLGADYRF
jgi:hypothetical protein